MSPYCARALVQGVVVPTYATQSCTRRRTREASRCAGRSFVSELPYPELNSRAAPAPGALRPPAAASSASSAGAGEVPEFPTPVLRIVLMRHAESEAAGNNNRTDHERVVTPQGASKAKSIAKALKSKGYIPNLFLSSNSARSKQTYGAMMETMPELEVADAHFFGSLYTESQMDGHTLPHLMELIRSLGDVTRHTCVLCLGHNKGWEEAASALAGEKVVLKNGDAALFEMDAVQVSWKDAMSRVGQKSGWRFHALLTE